MLYLMYVELSALALGVIVKLVLVGAGDEGKNITRKDMVRVTGRLLPLDLREAFL